MKKATAAHLSSLEGEFSWGNTSMEDHEAAMGKFAVNDPAESSLARLTRQLQVSGRIAIRNAGAVGQAQHSGDFDRGYGAKRHRKSAGGEAMLGPFHGLGEELKAALLTVGLEDAPSARKDERAMLEKQRAARQKKEELARTNSRTEQNRVHTI